MTSRLDRSASGPRLASAHSTRPRHSHISDRCIHSGTVATTSAMLGVFREDARTRMEFLELIKRPELNGRAAMMPMGLAGVHE